MTNKTPSSRQREIQIELLRARAAIERQTLSTGLKHLGHDLQPGSLLRSLLPKSVGRKKPSELLFQGVSLLRRYPFLISTASAVFSGVRKRKRLLRIGAGLLLSWQLSRGLSAQSRHAPPHAK